MSVGFSLPIIESFSSAPAVSRELETAGLGQVARLVNRSGFRSRTVETGSAKVNHHSVFKCQRMGHVAVE